MAASVRQRLLNIAHERNEDFQLVLVRYAVERLLHRLGQSAHEGRFVLKGAMLFQAWTGELHRSTLDLDLHGSGESAVETLVENFRDVCRQPVEDDGLVFDTDSLEGEEIREDQEYDGVRIHVTAKLGSAKIPTQIDIGFGDAITPGVERIQYPSLLEFPTPSFRAYPKETAVAEKYQTMVSLGIANSRMKDFFDLWVLATQSEFDGATICRAIAATFERRQTALPTDTPLALTPDFSGDETKQTQWRAFIRKGRLRIEAAGLEEVVALLEQFLMPPTRAAVEARKFSKKWSANGPWQ